MTTALRDGPSQTRGESPTGVPATLPSSDSGVMADTIPLDVRDIVVCVAGELGLPPNSLMADLGKSASLGRRIASALAVRRIMLSTPNVARRFGIASALVTDALSTLDAVLAYIQASVTRAPIAPLVTRVVAEWRRFEPSTRVRIPVAEVQETVAQVFQVSVRDLISARRTNDIVRPRHIAIYLAKRFTFASFPEIARAFGGRDHTTALHAARKIAPFADAIASRMADDASVEDWARALRREMG